MTKKDIIPITLFIIIFLIICYLPMILLYFFNNLFEATNLADSLGDTFILVSYYPILILQKILAIAVSIFVIKKSDSKALNSLYDNLYVPTSILLLFILFDTIAEKNYTIRNFYDINTFTYNFMAMYLVALINVSRIKNKNNEV